MTPKPLPVGGNVTAAFLNDLSGVYDRSTGTVDVANTAIETPIYSKVIAAGHMSSDRMLRLDLIGDYLQNAAGNCTLRIKFGGITIFDDNFSVSSDVNRMPVRLEVKLANLGIATSQFMQGSFALGNNVLPPTAGIGDLGPIQRLVQDIASNGTHTIDTALAQTFSVTAQWSAASASLSFRKRYAVLQLL